MRYLFLLPVILLSALIFYMSHQPEPVKLLPGFDFKDKLLHLVAYFIYAISVIIALIGFFKISSKKRLIWLTILIGCLYALSDELHQYFIPGRYAEFWDWLADCMGVFLSLFLINKIKQLVENYNNKMKMKINE